MKPFFKILLVIAFLFTTRFSIAQNTAPNPMQAFLDLRGHWEGKIDLNLGGAQFNVTYLLDFEKTSDNNGVVMYEKTTVPGVGTLNGTNLIGFDPFDGKYHWFSVDNFGTTHDHTGVFTDATHFYMEHNSVREGQNFQEKIWVDWINANTIKLKLIATTNGVVEQTAEGTFKRRGGNGNSQ